MSKIGLKGGKYISGRAVRRAFKEREILIGESAARDIFQAIDGLIDRRLNALAWSLANLKRKTARSEDVRSAFPEAFQK